MLRLACVTLIVLAAPAGAQTTAPTAPKAAKATKASPTDPLVTEARSAVARTLKDPSSAQFQNVRARATVNLRGEPMQVVCGDVNAKNSFGGYTGFAPWIYDDKTRSASVLGPDQNIATVAMLKSFCN